MRLGEGVRKREGLLCLDLYLGVCGQQGQGMLEVEAVIWVSSTLVEVEFEGGKVW